MESSVSRAATRLELPGTAPTPRLSARSVLALRSLRARVRLGCSAEERREPQGVRFDVFFRFPSVPAGCLSDALQDTICYAEVSAGLAELCRQREFALVERLGWAAYEATRARVSPDVEVWLRVTKEKPPVEGLEGGACFSLGDWEPAGGLD